jgi:hypothetical protein
LKKVEGERLKAKGERKFKTKDKSHKIKGVQGARERRVLLVSLAVFTAFSLS